MPSAHHGAAKAQPAAAGRKEMTMTVVFLGIDLAKNVFALHGVDAAGKPCLVRPQVRRDQLAELVARLPPCTSGSTRFHTMMANRYHSSQYGVVYCISASFSST